VVPSSCARVARLLPVLLSSLLGAALRNTDGPSRDWAAPA